MNMNIAYSIIFSFLFFGTHSLAHEIDVSANPGHQLSNKGHTPTNQVGRPNVLLISIDDLNDWTGCLEGHPQAKTPNINRLAERGTLFKNAHCQSPVCNPSRTSMMTGRHPHNSGLYFLSPDIKEAPRLRNLETLPQRFARNGYRTYAAGKIFHTGDQRFFQEFGGRFGGFGPRPKRKISQAHGHPLWDWGAFPKRDEDMPDYQVAQWAIEKLKSLPKNSEDPFLLGVGFFRPHVPMYVPQKWFDKFPREQVKTPVVNDDDRSDLSNYAIALTNKEHVSPEHSWLKSAGQWNHAVQAYLASSAFVDHCVGLVLAALDESTYRDNTIIVLFSDHGFHLGEKQRWAKRSLWEDSTRVPLIVVAPGYGNKQQCSQPTQLLDVYPTLLDLAGLPEDKKLEGQSLVPLLKNPQTNWPHVAMTNFGPGNYAIRSRHFRYIRYLDGSEELYDHREDPQEWNNLAAQSGKAGVLAQHRKYLPIKEQPILPGNSTGHKAYAAAKASIQDSASVQGKAGTQDKASTEKSNGLKWRVQRLHKDNNEGIAVGDIDGDGKLDITAGEFWYQAPKFQQRPLRKLAAFGKDYLQNNSEHLFDMDGDGDLDVLSGSFTDPVVNWFENPGAGNYEVDHWRTHKLVNTGTGQNEATFLHDIDGDGKPEFIENSWNSKSPMQIFKLVRGKDGKVSAKRHSVSKSGNGHGMGFGDINGDGRQDIIYQGGWYEQPKSGAFSGPWTHHKDFELRQASCPILVLDLNEDGKNDIIWGCGHNYGLYWHEQLEPQANGKTRWRQHLIDKSFSQAHTLAWDDIDKDGNAELITGKRYYGHSGSDAGANDAMTIQYYDWNPADKTWAKNFVSVAKAGKGPGTGLQIRIHDLDGNGWKDIIVPGKSGTHIIWNNGK